MSNPTNKLIQQTNYAISLRLLGGLLISFLAGYVVHNFIANANATNIYSFTTPDLINFILSVLLSGASMVLAISAISLGKFSEQAMIQRSDESIRLQNEVFQKTTDALQRIESSTGLTEKRLEDIIAGRVGDLSQKIAKIATETKGSDDSLRQEEIERLIRKTLLRSVGSSVYLPPTESLEEIEAEMKERNRRREANQKYDVYHDKLESAITQHDELRALKLGQGEPTASGMKLFDDVIINSKHKKIGLLDFPALVNSENFRTATEGALKELYADTVDYIYMLIYEPNAELEIVFNDVVSMVDPQFKSRMSFSVCPVDQIDSFVETLITKV